MFELMEHLLAWPLIFRGFLEFICLCAPRRHIEEASWNKATLLAAAEDLDRALASWRAGRLLRRRAA